MSNETPEQAAAREAAAKDQAERERLEKAEQQRLAQERKSLIKVTKDGEHLFVHPTCVKAHEDAGWKVAA